jgi:hypothetical protein
MLVACRLAGLSALGAHYAGVGGRAQCEALAKLCLMALTPPLVRFSPHPASAARTSSAFSRSSNCVAETGDGSGPVTPFAGCRYSRPTDIMMWWRLEQEEKALRGEELVGETAKAVVQGRLQREAKRQAKQKARPRIARRGAPNGPCVRPAGPEYHWYSRQPQRFRGGAEYYRL